MNKEQIRAMIKRKKENYSKHLFRQFNALEECVIKDFLANLKEYLKEQGFEKVNHYGNLVYIEIEDFSIQIVLQGRKCSMVFSIQEMGLKDSTLMSCNLIKQFKLKGKMLDNIIESKLCEMELGDFVLNFFKNNKQKLLKLKEKYKQDRQIEYEFFKTAISLIQAKIPTNYQVEYSILIEHGIAIIFNDNDSCRIQIRGFEESGEMYCKGCYENEELEDNLLDWIRTNKISTEEFVKMVLCFFDKHAGCITQKYAQEQEEQEFIKSLIAVLQEKFKGTNFYVYPKENVFEGFYISTIEKSVKLIGASASAIDYDGRSSLIRCYQAGDTNSRQIQEILQQTEPHFNKTQRNYCSFDMRNLKKEISLETLNAKDIAKITDYIYAYCLEHKEWLIHMDNLIKKSNSLVRDFITKTYEFLKEKFEKEPNWELELKESKDILELNLNFKGEIKEAQFAFKLLKIRGVSCVEYILSCGIFEKCRHSEIDLLKTAYLIENSAQNFNTCFRSEWLDYRYVEDALNLEKSFLESLEDKSLNAENYGVFVYNYFKKRQEIIEVLNENIEEFILK
ncbi:hypothetical protein [Helicobacter cetorum]|uniref:Uncharacterized protein n=1 Tax=Helicobacter cetorum (strain ATCC BAA-429 / MIT 00-7128) TaxID=182217 RepID=I0EL51_HELC0|nr:hypothetical protein [Helicobacter cetorum]AFI03670.1 hypothetical protein HCW_01925 [Helicobacter cetorum MIT 00-7128]